MRLLTDRSHMPIGGALKATLVPPPNASAAFSGAALRAAYRELRQPDGVSGFTVPGDMTKLMGFPEALEFERRWS